MTSEEQLVDYRRRVAAMYACARDHQLAPAARCQRFRQERDALFCSHPQSALSAAQQAGFQSLHYYPYDPVYRFALSVEPETNPTEVEIMLEHDGLLKMRRFGK